MYSTRTTKKLRGGLPTKTLHWKQCRENSYPKASDADSLTYLRQILCLGEALEVVGGLPKWMEHDLLRVLAVRRVTPIGALPEGWMILLAHSVSIHGEVRLLSHTELVHAPLHEHVLSPRAKLPIWIIALPSESRLAVLEVDTTCGDMVALQPREEPCGEEDRVCVDLNDPVAARRQLLLPNVQPGLVEHHGIDPRTLLLPLEQVEVGVNVKHLGGLRPVAQHRFHVAVHSPLGTAPM